MKCPKCQYISFDSPDRCRNCGYDFSLASGSAPPDDPVLSGDRDADGPFPDLSLRPLGGPDPTPPAGRARARTDRIDLPLFNEPVPGLDDTPLISAPSAPRAPLAVRKATPDPSRIARPSRAGRGAPGEVAALAPDAATSAGAVPETPAQGGPRERPLGAGPRHGARPPEGPPLFPGSVAETEGPERPRPAGGVAVPTASTDTPGTPAPAGARLLAALVDVALLAAIDLTVVHSTLAVLRHPWDRLLELPLLPLLGFCLMLNAGYVLAFTVASGQTIGKMMAGVRVVADDSWRVPVTQAAIRTAIAPVSLVPLGLGYLPALIGTDRRTLHDRLSNTRVVRA